MYKRDIEDDPYFLNGTRYCYDNVWADLMLADGDHNEVEGAFGYYDLFTWEGWVSAVSIGMFATFLEEMIWNFMLTTFMVLFYLGLPGMTICAEGDIEVFGISLCFWAV
jgi:hypothetical protein